VKKTVSNFWMIFAVGLAVLLGGCASHQAGDGKGELATSSDQTDNQKRARLRLQLAVGYFEQGQNSVALDEIKQALAADPDMSDAYNVRALVYMRMGETHLAEENFLHAIKLAPDNPDLSNNYGWFLCQNGRAAQSLSYFESTLNNRTYQSPAKAMYNAGVCSLKLNDPTAAERYFLQAFKIEPANPSISASLARIYYDRHDYERARFYIGRVTKADVMNPDVLWLAIKVEHRLGDKAAEASLATQLRRRHPGSPEFASYQRGAFDE
jgi:type IV pilus assembly protein PilF